MTTGRPENIDALVELAKEACDSSVGVPADRSHTGAVVVDSSGRRWRAGSIDTPTREVGICSERAALFYAITNGSGPITYVVIATKGDSAQMHPCTACLDAISRFAPDSVVVVSRGEEPWKSASISAIYPFPAAPSL